MKAVIVTGGAGFIGSNFIRYFLEKHKDYIVINYDLLTYAGNLDNLEDIEHNPNYEFIQGDICDREKFSWVLEQYDPDYIVNFAAESHVDRSIDGPLVFGNTNVIGTMNLLQCAKQYWQKEDYDKKRFLQVSTDEVYGSIENDFDVFTENSNLLPNSPYSASKAGADLMVRAFGVTYGFPAIVTRCCNNYGPNQYHEKFIPTCISYAIKNQPIPIYGNGTNVREWIHVLDHSRAIDLALFYGKNGEIYNIGSGEEVSNIKMAGLILKILGKPQDLMTKVQDRPGHDKRYAIDSSKIRSKLKWSCQYQLEDGISQTVLWYVKNPAFLNIDL